MPNYFACAVAQGSYGQWRENPKFCSPVRVSGKKWNLADTVIAHL